MTYHGGCTRHFTEIDLTQLELLVTDLRATLTRLEHELERRRADSEREHYHDGKR